jgi:hypothetical protein
MNRIAWILTGLFVVLVVVLIFLLRDDEPTETSTTLLASATTTLVASTTSEQTSTTSAQTTTSLASTTTTVAETTTTGLPGNWASEPLVTWNYGSLGWWDGNNWVQVQDGTSLPVSGNESYQVAHLGIQATITGGPQLPMCDPLNNPGVELSNPESLGEFPDPTGVAISAPWQLVPNLVEVSDDDATYSAIASGLLAERGLSVPDPLIKQALTVDLEGDGINEVLVVTEDIPDPGLLAEDGDYSLVFLSKAVGGEVRSLVIAESIVTELAEGETPFILSFGIGAVADLNGDGKMEMVISSNYYEGSGVEVWEYVDDDQGPVLAISQGCGV